MKPRYFHESLGQSIGPLIGERSREGGLKRPWDLLKWKISVLECLTIRPKLLRSLERILYPQNKCELEMEMDLF